MNDESQKNGNEKMNRFSTILKSTEHYKQDILVLLKHL